MSITFADVPKKTETNQEATISQGRESTTNALLAAKIKKLEQENAKLHGAIDAFEKRHANNLKKISLRVFGLQEKNREFSNALGSINRLVQEMQPSDLPVDALNEEHAIKEQTRKLVHDWRLGAVYSRRFRSWEDLQFLPDGLNYNSYPNCVLLGGAATLSYLKKLKEAHDISLVVDLRFEPHGYLGDSPVSFFEPKNSCGKGEKVSNVSVFNKKLMDEISGKREYPLYRIERKSLDGELLYASKEVLKKVPEVMLEADAVKSIGIDYVRMPIPDHSAIPNELIDSFIGLLSRIAIEKPNVYIHCRGGAGRATTVAVLLDYYIHLKEKKTLGNALQRQYLIGGRNLKSLPQNTNYKYELSMERKTRIQKIRDLIDQKLDKSLVSAKSSLQSGG